jgi:hypothetical protein
VEPVEEGVANLVNNCAEVKRGEIVLLLNARGEAEADVVDLITEAVRAAGGRERVIWLDPPARGGGPGTAPSLSEELVSAISAADKVIALYPLSDRSLVQALGDTPSVLVANTMFRTKDDFASNHARYHWGMANAIYERFEKELFAPGRSFRLANPAGTDVRGASASSANERVSSTSIVFLSAALSTPRPTSPCRLPGVRARP